MLISLQVASGPSAEYGCNHQWTAASVQHGDYGEVAFHPARRRSHNLARIETAKGER
jgi:hypothetical protein